MWLGSSLSWQKAMSGTPGNGCVERQPKPRALGNAGGKVSGSACSLHFLWLLLGVLAADHLKRRLGSRFVLVLL